MLGPRTNRDPLALLPHLCVAVLLRRKGSRRPAPGRAGLPAIEAPHQSPQVLHIRTAARARIESALSEVRDLVKWS